MFKLNYSLRSVQERLDLVNQILSTNPDPPPRYLEYLADYLIFPIEQEERRTNRKKTWAKRETSLESLADSLGEDGVQSLQTQTPRQYLAPKKSITPEDLATIPFLPQIQDSISYWRSRLPLLSGKDAYIAKQAIIDLSQDQYVVKYAYHPITQAMNPTRTPAPFPLTSEEAYYHFPVYAGVSLLDPKVCAGILANYTQLASARIDTDAWCLIQDFNQLYRQALAPYPFLQTLAALKVQGHTNTYISSYLLEHFGHTHTKNYISTLWCAKIPKLIANAAEEQFLDFWFLTKEKGEYKTCGRCGQVKLAHPRYYAINRKSFYSICKECRKGVNRK